VADVILSLLITVWCVCVLLLESIIMYYSYYIILMYCNDDIDALLYIILYWLLILLKYMRKVLNTWYYYCNCIMKLMMIVVLWWRRIPSVLLRGMMPGENIDDYYYCYCEAIIYYCIILWWLYDRETLTTVTLVLKVREMWYDTIIILILSDYTYCVSIDMTLLCMKEKPNQNVW